MKPTIVFVHLNSPVPLYLKLNIVSTIRKFPQAKVILIRNVNYPIKIHPNLQHFEYKPGYTSLSIENSLSHPREFRNNFWFSAIQRFDALRSYMEKNKEPILHLESDVIISKDFPFREFFMSNIKIAFPLVSDNRGVASSVFIRDLVTVEKLVQFADEACLVNSNTTDMEILASFFEKNVEITFLLAFGPINAHAYNEKFVIERVLPSFKTFHGVFDGNDIGVFLFGTNPRNARGISYMRTSNPGNYARVNQWGFKFDKLREFINLEFDGEVIPIYSIHATSKQITLFHHFTQNFFIKRFLHQRVSERGTKIFPFMTLTMAIHKGIKSLKI